MSKKLGKTSKNLYDKDSKPKIKKGTFFNRDKKTSPKMKTDSNSRKLYTSEKLSGLNKGKFNVKFNEYLSKHNTGATTTSSKLNFMKKDTSNGLGGYYKINYKTNY